MIRLDLVFSKKKQKPMIAWIGGPRDERLTLDLVFSKKTKGHDLVFSKKQKAMIRLDLVFSKKNKRP